MSITTAIVALGIISAFAVGVATITSTSAEAQEGSTISISIVPGASTLANTTYQPNPG